MDPFRGIIVQVLSNGKILKFYDDPDATEIGDHRTRQHYIEAVTGATFEVKVLLTNEFDLGQLEPNDAVWVELEFDDWHRNWYRYLTRRELERNFRQGLPGTYNFSSISHFSGETGQWISSDFSFGNLVLKESAASHLPAAQVKDLITKVKNLGKIRLSVRRVKIEQLSVPEGPRMLPLSPTTEVLEKALKGRAISNTISLANGVPVSAPKPRKQIPKALSGASGKPMVYNIYYRSKRDLQIIGCIPRSPSPAEKTSDVRASAPIIDIDVEEAQREVQNLRSRLALLERGLNIKAESTGIASTLKRERDRDDVENGSSHRRPRKAVKLETIDLTDD